MVPSLTADEFLSPETIFDRLTVWLNSEEAAIYLRKFTRDGKPSVGAIRTAVCRGILHARKWRRRLYFKKAELDVMIELGTSQKTGGL